MHKARDRDKSPLLLLTALFLWLVPLFYFGPRIWSIIQGSENPAQIVLFSVSGLLLLIFWLISAHLTATVAFSFGQSDDFPPAPINPAFPSVAILYTTCDDFQYEAALSCVNQDYPSFTVYLLDDSRTPTARDEVDTFHHLFPARTQIIRRNDRKGYKAGNLNNALRCSASAHEFLVLADADEILPTGFLKAVLPHFSEPTIGFVQSNHETRYDARSAFANDLALTGTVLWEIVCRPKNRFGFVVCLGHGVMIRRAAWEAVGGFPEVVSEDFAFTLLIASEGWKGRYVSNVYCYEEFPSNYQSFKRRQEKYIVGVTETMLKFTGKLLRSRHVTITEKADYLIWTAPLFIPPLCLIFLLISTIATAGIGVQARSLVLRFFNLSLTTPPIVLGSPSFGPLVGWDFEVLSGICGLAPAFACIALCLRRGLPILRPLSVSVVPYMSLMVVSWRGLIRLAFKGFTFFVSTGARECEPDSNTNRKPPSWQWKPPQKTEVFLGVILTIASIAWMNFGFVGISSTLWIGACIERVGWEARISRFLCRTVYVLVVAQYLTIAVGPLISSWGP